jgi:1-deoxy-D-xylulose 5-phosphate reductoisomerase
VFNAANERAVALFLEGKMQFADIATSIDAALAELGSMGGGDKASLLAADCAARAHVSARAERA